MCEIRAHAVRPYHGKANPAVRARRGFMTSISESPSGGYENRYRFRLVEIIAPQQIID
jgi:hypothetical protein